MDLASVGGVSQPTARDVLAEQSERLAVAHRELSRATAAAVGRAAQQRRESGRERHQRVRGDGGGERGSCHGRGRTGRGRCASHVLGKCAGDIEHAEAVAVEKAPHVVFAADP